MTPSRPSFSSSFGWLLFLSLAVLLSAAPVKFDIPAQPAPGAIGLFIKQSGTRVAYVESDLKEVTTQALNGEHEPADALALLLKDSGFSVSERRAGWFSVVRAGSQLGAIDGSVREEKTGRPVANATVSIVGTDKSAVTGKRGGFLFENIPAGDYTLTITATGMQNTKVTDVVIHPGSRLSLSVINIPVQQEGPLKLEPYTVSAKKNDRVLELDPYAVSGQREKPFADSNVDIPRTENDAQPYYILDSKAIEQSGTASIEEFLKQRLTMNTTALTNGQFVSLTGGNTSSVNLRGLGADKTLILINGRRVAGASLSLTSDSAFQPDLNTIPVSAVDRIEVLPSSASSIYGGSAVGGVVNVILKKNYSGGEIRANYTNTWDSDAPSKTVSVSYGAALEGGKTNVSLSGSWSEASALRLRDREDLYSNNLQRIQQNSPTFLFSSTTPFAGSLPNIITTSATLTTLTLKNGTPINSRVTHVGSGISPNSPISDLNASLLGNAGSWDLNLPESTLPPTGLLQPLSSEPEIKSFRASVQRKMLPWLELYADGTYSENNANMKAVPYGNQLLVTTASAINPFTTGVRISVPVNAEYPYYANSQNTAFGFGAIGKFAHDWVGLLDYSWSRNRFEYIFYNVDTAARTADLLSGALNPFVDTLKYPLNQDKYVSAPTLFSSASELQEATLKASGPLPALPWGTPALTVGAEYRLAHTPENTQNTKDPVSSNDYLLKSYARDSVTTSAYIEGLVPLLRKNLLPGLYSLEIQAAGRFERNRADTGTPSEYTFYNAIPPTTFYNSPTIDGKPYFSTDTYVSDNYTVGLKYQPFDSITFRASRATAFLPPSPNQLLRNPVVSTFTQPVNDPVTGQNGVQVFSLGGGNPELKPQNSKSFNAGIIWEGKGALHGLRANVEYYKIEQFDAIAQPSLQQVVDREALLPGRVTRNSSGTITQVNASLINLFYRNTEGWDLGFDYELRTTLGTWVMQSSISIISRLEDQYSEKQPAYDAAGYSPAESGAPKRKAAFSLNWEKGHWQAGWFGSYTDSYKQYGAAGGPRSMQFFAGAADPQYITAQGSDTIPSQIYHDVFVGYVFTKERLKTTTIGAKLLGGVSIQVGVRNVFNKEPPLDAYYAATQYFSPYGSLQLRTYWLTVRKSF